MKELNLLITFFFIYSFFGWIIECTYKAIIFKRFINSGFLFGPFVPLYGLGALVIIVFENYIGFLPLWVRLIIFTITANLIEYYAGALLEAVFHVKLWDYSNMFLNIKGRICLLHSIYWMLLSFLFIKYIHPFIKNIVGKIPDGYLLSANNLLIIYITLDLLYSVKFMNKFLKFVNMIKLNFKMLPKVAFEKVTSARKRLIFAFPNLKKYLEESLKENFFNALEKLKALKNVNNKKEKVILSEEEQKEFYSITEDIITHPIIEELKKYKHHHRSIYHHSLTVAMISYKIAKFFKLDYISTARGALLHDFFFYDWRKERPMFKNKKQLHGFYHNIEALKNAKKYFKLNEIEKDIILKHMFPLTPHVPKYKETVLVLIVDKIVASKELFVDFIEKLK